MAREPDTRNLLRSGARPWRPLDPRTTRRSRDRCAGRSPAVSQRRGTVSDSRDRPRSVLDGGGDDPWGALRDRLAYQAVRFTRGRAMTTSRAQRPRAARERLEALYRTFDHVTSASDPVHIVRRYPAAEDREVVGFCAAALAFGRG